MPHDRKGRELKVGDKVVLEGEVTAVYPDAETCNVTVKTAYPRPDGQHDTVTLTAGHVLKTGGQEDA